MINAGTQFRDALFFFLTGRLVGCIWDDSFHPGHRYPGADISAGGEPFFRQG
jgi:hypothetical protein